LLAFLCANLPVTSAQSAAAKPSDPPYIVEWVYKVKYGYQDEFWQIFKKYQIATLNREKELGNILKYEVFRPGLHTSEDHRWDYRIVIYYKNVSMPNQASAIEKQLFPDQATMKREENRRWEITAEHWDLPIREMNPNAPEP
jgi:hypothetical protein